MTTEEVTARLVDAADIVRRMPDTARPKGYGTAWPTFVHLFEDRVFWSAERHKDDADARLRARAPDSREVTRAEAVERWLIEHVKRDKDRITVSAWAMCKAGASIEYHAKGKTRRTRSFSVWCQHVGHVSRDTAYKYRDRAISDIVFATEGISDTFGTGDGDLQPDGIFGTSDDNMGEAPPVLAMMTPDAKPTDNPETRDMDWSNRQNERRRKMMAKLEPETT